jgi:DNA-binding transcriptional LysR family regulator
MVSNSSKLHFLEFQSYLGMDIQQLRHFVAIVESGSLVRAAERCGITQSGLTRSLQTLEASLELPLFERRRKGVILSEFGQELLPRARAILNERDRAIQELRATRRLERGQLRIGIMPSFNYALAPDWAAAFLAASEGVDLSIVTGTHDELADKLESAALHCALVLALEPRQRELAYQPLFAAETGVFAAKDHPLAKSRKLKPEALLKYPWALTESTALRRAFEEFFREQTGEIPRVRLTTASISMLIQSLQRSNLLCVLPRDMLHSPVVQDSLRCLDVPAPAGRAHAWLVTRHYPPPGPALQRAIALLREQLAARDPATAS